MPREIELFGFLMPTLLPLFIAAVAVHWALDGVLGRSGFYRHVGHPPLLRLCLFVCLFAGSALLIY